MKKKLILVCMFFIFGCSKGNYFNSIRVDYREGFESSTFYKKIEHWPYVISSEKSDNIIKFIEKIDFSSTQGILNNDVPSPDIIADVFSSKDGVEYKTTVWIYVFSLESQNSDKGKTVTIYWDENNKPIWIRDTDSKFNKGSWPVSRGSHLTYGEPMK